MLWSVIPEEIVFDKWDEAFTLEERTYQQRKVRVRVGQDGYGSIEGIISSNPKDFMNKELRPGTKIRL